MVNVSNEYLEQINSLSKSVYWYGKVTLKDGTEYEFDIANLSQGKTKIRKELCPNKFGIGGTCSAELTIAFMLDYDEEYDTYTLNGLIVNRYDFYEANIELNFRLYLSEDETYYEDIYLGNFIVTDPERSQLVLTCTAYDYMQKFAKPCVSEIQGSFYNNLLSACSICGVELGNTIQEINAMVNGRKTIAEYDPKNQIQTWRDVIGYIAAILCANAIIKNNKLYIVPFKTTTDRYITSEDRVKLKLEDYTASYGSITAVNLRNNTQERVTIDESLLQYSFGTNPFIQYTVVSAREEVLGNILENLHSLNFVPYSCEVFLDPSYELGDVVEFTDNHAQGFNKSVIASLEITINGHMKISCDGDDPYLKKAEESSSSSYAKDTGGAVGDGVRFFDYISQLDQTIAEGVETEIVSITYTANGKFRQEFLSELKIGVATDELLVNEEYTENDLDILVTYYLNGQEVISYHPEHTFTDGVFLLHLFYFWSMDARIPESTFSATITVNGGTITILRGNNRSRIMQSGISYAEASNRLEYIDVTHQPNKMVYKIGEELDFTGLVVSAFYEDGHSEVITPSCTFDPVEGSEVLSRYYINVNVNYEKDGKNYRTAFGLEVNPIIEIEVVQAPTKTVYRVGETINLSGIRVDAIYDNGAHKNVTSECSFLPMNGERIDATYESLLLNITYENYSVVYQTVYDGLIFHKLLILDVSKDPTKDEYFVGETIDLSGVEITAEYLDDTTAIVTNQCTFDPPNGTVITNSGAVNVNVTYTEDGVTKTALIPLVAIDVVPDELIIEPPDKTTYRVGETLDLEGCEVIAKYNNGTQRDVTEDCVFTPADGSTIAADTNGVQVTFTDNHTTVTETIDLNIITFDGIEITTPPSKVEYYVGDSLDLTGLVVSGLWSDNSKDNITSQCRYTPANGSVLNRSSISAVAVNYVFGGQSYQESIEIVVKALTGIEVSEPPTKTEYMAGEVFDFTTGLQVMAQYSDGSEEDVTSQCDVYVLGSTSHGEQAKYHTGDAAPIDPYLRYRTLYIEYLTIQKKNGTAQIAIYVPYKVEIEASNYYYGSTGYGFYGVTKHAGSSARVSGAKINVKVTDGTRDVDTVDVTSYAEWYGSTSKSSSVTNADVTETSNETYALIDIVVGNCGGKFPSLTATGSGKYGNKLYESTHTTSRQS